MIRKTDGLRIVGASPSEVIEDGGLWVVAHKKRGRVGVPASELNGETILIAVDITNLNANWLPASDIEFEDGDIEFEDGDVPL